MSAFDKIIGYESVKRELRQVADMIGNFSKYEKLGAKMPGGIILHGIPGVGKTMLAKALLEDTGVPYEILRHDMAREDFCERIKSTFDAMAGREGRSIILLDDLDKFSMEERNGEEFAVVQSCIDSVKGTGVFVIATANDMHVLPSSLTRSGRFDRVIKVGKPEGEDAVRIITHYMEGMKVAKDINYEDIAKMLTGRSCATLESVINEAAIEAAFENKESIEMKDFVKATLSDVYGLENLCGELGEDKKEELAYHEAGHAVIAEVLMPAYVGMVSLSTNVRSGVQGFMLRCKNPERRAYEILIALGGKAACEMQFGRIASGTSSDLDDAASHLNSSITYVGSRGMGLLEVGVSSPYSLNNREQVVYAELERNLFKAKEIIAQNREFLDRVAKELLEKNTLLYSDMKRIRESCTITPAVVG